MEKFQAFSVSQESVHSRISMKTLKEPLGPRPPLDQCEAQSEAMFRGLVLGQVQSQSRPGLGLRVRSEFKLRWGLISSPLLTHNTALGKCLPY